jgi:hypothetical protein
VRVNRDDLEPGKISWRRRFVDVLAGKVFEAPESFKARRKDIETACWNIKDVWSTVTPRD